MKHKKRSTKKSDLALLMGAQFGWTAVDPLAPGHDITETWMGHRNSIKGLILKRPGNRKLFMELTDTRALKWKVTIEMEFKTPDGKQYFRGADIVIHGILKRMDGHYQQALEDIFNEANMRHYITTRMVAEIIGAGPIQEKDFEEVA